MSTKPRKESPALAATNKPGTFQNNRHANSITLGPACKCPLCTSTPSLEWLLEFDALLNKYSHLGYTPDLTTLTPEEACGLYNNLKRCEDYSWP